MFNTSAALACDCVGDHAKASLETMLVPASGQSVSSTFIPQTGKVYFLKASGTYSYWPGSSPYGIADAECSYRPSTSYGPGWVLGEDVFPATKTSALDILVDGINVSWGSTCNLVDHTYIIPYVGQGAPISFHIFDSDYGDNSGGLNVEIYECI